MEPEDPQSHEGRTDRDGDSNVVPFPRDWLGPRDELVPVGTPNRGESSGAPLGPSPRSSVTGPVGTTSDPPREPGSDPRSPADDFWGGEGSGAIHEVLRAPDPVDVGPRTVAEGREVVGRRRSNLAARAVRRRLPLVLTWPLALMLCAGAGVALAAVILTGPGRRAARVAPAPGSAAGAATLDRLIATARADVMPAVEGVARRVLAAQRRAARVHRATRSRTRKRPVRTRPDLARRPTPRPAPSNTPGGSTYTAPAPVSAPAVSPPAAQSSGSGAAAVSSGVPSGNSGTASTGSGVSTSGSSSSTSSGASAASGRPAFGANGVLGPGTSPDS